MVERARREEPEGAGFQTRLEGVQLYAILFEG
jgi:hypothetical protein